MRPRLTPTDTSRCPYKGLEYFDLNDDDPHYFFGREALTGQLLDQVRTSNFLALVGASGNGKSSVLRAGLLHQLRLGRRIAGSDQWQIVIMRPDAQPMKNLATAFLPEDGSQLDRAEALGRAEGLLREGGAGLARLVEVAPAPRVMLVVDQFEEVFTRCEDIDERSRFFACLMGALQTTGDKLCLVIAMRSDFVGKCLERDYSGLAQQVQQHMESVLPMRPDELRDAICKPAVQVGLTVEDALVTEILNDIQGAPGSLPLLQYTLKELWQRRQGNQLVLSAYQALGGINGTLDQRATELYNSFDPDQQRTVQHIFQQLTQLGEGTEDTRRRVFLDNLVSEPLHPAERVQTVVETLANKDNRLLVTSEVVSKGDDLERQAIVDVAHEALIRHWTLLRQWIEQNRDLLRQQRRIEASAVAWQEHQKLQGYLLQGLPLDEAIQFQKQQAETFPLSDMARAFIQKSRRHRQWTRFKTASWLVIPALVIVGIVEHNIREQRVRADIGRIDDNEGGSAEKYAVVDLVKGCGRGVPRPDQSLLGNYIGERILLGQCRSLSGFDLSYADLSYADLSYADLRDADLSYANLSYANLRDAYLRSADLSSANLRDAYLRSADLSSAYLRSADLRSADLSSADLSSAYLRYAILLATDLRGETNLTSQHLVGENQPYLCNVALPDTLTDIEPDVELDRDCDAMPKVLRSRYGLSPEDAQQLVDEARQKQWE
ncbi:pentapeptide repeat-containing protein [Leptolyngbya sp. CCNP1308]|uniref:nSTAND1 domain-containing NTPase n=1 Tax=Leptolyngbya sp. CCNP1308 TaxID=3110255 RepID=UPI002B20DB3B|nr:pentapeptide repeat-containing protein [Leptolyngbya sp. CCNP1308]MEA5449576.1 pentapeptide repeat-containing protein [Leptolyngbya sp. CCNP1308]